MLEMPKFIEEGWGYTEGNEPGWKLKPDAPEWAKREYEEFQKTLETPPNDEGIVTVY